MNAVRTTDIIETSHPYPMPPAIPLPTPGDWGSLERIGVKLTPFSRRALSVAFTLSGFSRFQKKLPAIADELLRWTNVRGPAVFAPVISATAAIASDPRTDDPFTRAATLIHSTLSFHADYYSGNLEPDRFKNDILEMGQYANLFGTGIAFRKSRPELFKTTNTRHILLAIRGNFYILDLAPFRNKPVSMLAGFLKKTAEKTDEANDFSPGILTCAPDRFQCRVFPKLEKDPHNREALDKMRHTFFTVCLDLDSKPKNSAECGYSINSLECHRHWNHSSMQIVVVGNGRAGFVFSFSAYLDGNVMARAASEIWKRAKQIDLETETTAEMPPENVISPLRLNIARPLLDEARHVFENVRDEQQATFELAIGTKTLGASKPYAIELFSLAMQKTIFDLTGALPEINQFLTMSRYRYQGLTTAMISSEQVKEYVRKWDEQSNPQEKARLLYEALDSQKKACRQARKYLTLDQCLPLYRKYAGSWKGTWHMLVFWSTLQFLKLIGLHKPRGRAVLISHPAIFDGVELIGRPGIRLPYIQKMSLHFQIFEERTVITYMPTRYWKISNAEFSETLERNLRQLAERAARDSTAAQKKGLQKQAR